MDLYRTEKSYIHAKINGGHQLKLDLANELPQDEVTKYMEKPTSLRDCTIHENI